MKKFILFPCIVFFHQIIAQVPMSMPPDADAFYKNAMPTIRPQLKNIITKSAGQLKIKQANADSLIKVLHSNTACKNMNDENIEAISTLIMVQASNDADEDLKKIVLSMRNNNGAEQVSNIDNGNANGSLQEINDKKQLMVQMIMHRKSKIAEEITPLIRKIYTNRENIINNLK